MKKAISLLLLFAALLGLIAPASASGMSGIVFITNVDYDGFYASGSSRYAYFEDEVAASNGDLTIQFEMPFRYCILYFKQLSGSPDPRESAEAGVLLDSRTMTGTTYTIGEEQLEPHCWYKISLQSVEQKKNPSSYSYICNYYFYVEERAPRMLSAVPIVENPSVDIYSTSSIGSLYGFFETDLDASNGLYLSWFDCFDKYRVFVKILNGNPSPDLGSEEGILIRDSYQEEAWLTLSASELSGYSGRVMKLSVQGLMNGENGNYSRIVNTGTTVR